MSRHQLGTQRGRKEILRRARRCRPMLETLETRLAPVIGGLGYAPVLAPGTVVGGINFDGVVQISDPATGSYGSGSLLNNDGLHILTATHVVNPLIARRVTFNLPQTAPGRAALPAININVPAAAGFQHNAPGFAFTPSSIDNDISLLRLTDQVTPAPNRMLVAPFYGAQIGYPIVANAANDLAPNVFTMAGYGITGTGTIGGDAATANTGKRIGTNTFDAPAQILNNSTQVVGITGNPNAGAAGGSFRLTYTPPAAIGGAAVTTGNIQWDATAAQVQAALVAAAPGLAGNVIVTGGRDWPAAGLPGQPQFIAQPGDRITWFITFQGTHANMAVPQVTIASAPAPNALAGAGVGTSQAIRWQGGIQRAPAGNGGLLYDFDNGSTPNDAVGLFYGIANTGVTRANEIQVITATNGPNYTLRHTPLQTAAGAAPAPVTTAALAWNAPANPALGPNSVQAALEAILGANTVLVNPGPGLGQYTVQFIGPNLAGNDLNQLVALNAAGTAPSANVSVSTLTNGRSDNMQGGGDSGGPAFINGQIAGLVSYDRDLTRGANGHHGVVPDVNAVIDAVGRTDRSFGEFAVMTRVSSFLPWINNTINLIHPSRAGAPAGAARYHLVFDMAQQAFGVDGVNEAITITAQRVGVNIEIQVSGGPAGTVYNGTYFIGAADDIQSLTIRGGADHETIHIVGNLWQGDPVIARPITIHGGGGNDNVILGAAGGGNLNDYTGNVVVDGAGGTNTLEVNDVAAPAGRNNFVLTADTLTWGAATNIQFQNITELTLNAGNFNDTVNVRATNAATTTSVYSGGGTNVVNVGSTNDATSTLNNILGNLVVSGCGGTDTLNVNDQGAMAANQAYTVTDSTVRRGAGATITYWCLTNLNLNAGGGGNVISVQSTATGTATRVNAGAGNDRITVASAAPNPNRLDEIQGPLTVDGQAGTNDIVLDDSGSPAGQQYRFAANSVTRVGGPAITTLNWTTRTTHHANAPQAMAVPGNSSEVLSARAGAQDILITGNNDDVITFALTAPLQNALIVIDGGLNRDRVVVAQGLVSTDQVDLVDTEDLEVSGDGLSLGGLTAAETFLVPGDYLQSLAGRLYLELGGASSGSDQLVVNGSVSLGGTLTLGTLPGFSGDSFILIDNTGPSPVNGTFAGLPEGAVLTLGGRQFSLSYIGGTGNDVVLTATGSGGSGGSIGDFVWYDNDNDGVQDAGESGASGVTVNLLDGLGNWLSSTTTDSAGYYHFSGLAAGSYKVKFYAPFGYSFSPQDQGLDDSRDSDADANGVTAIFTLAPGQTRTDLDAGLYYTGSGGSGGSVGDFVWSDSNNNGIQDAGEGGYSGVTVKLLDANGGVLQTTTTDSAGAYQFYGLAAGNYQVQFTAPFGYSFSPQDQGADDTLDSDADGTGATALFSLATDQQRTDLDAGLYYTGSGGSGGSIGDYVWYDGDNDGVQDAGESGASGVTVNLLDGLGNWLSSTTTDSAGHYQFAGLAAGDYQVQFAAPFGYSFSPQDQGADDALDSDADGTGTTVVYTLATDQQRADVDAGLYYTGSGGSFTTASFTEFATADTSGDDSRTAEGFDPVEFALLRPTITPAALPGPVYAHRPSFLSPGAGDAASRRPPDFGNADDLDPSPGEDFFASDPGADAVAALFVLLADESDGRLNFDPFR